MKRSQVYKTLGIRIVDLGSIVRMMIASSSTRDWGVRGLVHAGGDDPLAKQETMSHLNCAEPDPESNLAPGSAIGLNLSCLCSFPNDNVQMSKSRKFVGCSIVKQVHPAHPSRDEEREREIAESEHFLKLDWRFRHVVDQMKSLGPGPERIAVIDDFWRGVYGGYCVGEREMLRVRARALSDYIRLLDEDRLARERASRPSHVVVRGGAARISMNFLMGERTYRPSHVGEGGSDYLEECLQGVPIPPMCTHDAREEVDRSSPDTDGRSSLGSSVVR
jgi:hypothetical protein